MQCTELIPLLNHLIGEGEELVWHGHAERPRAFKVDHQLDLTCLHDWQVARLLAIEDATSILADLLISAQKKLGP
jgi:hypothetical protein